MGEIFKTAKANWSVISAAPWAFGAWTIILIAVIWALVEYLKRNRIEDLEGRLKLRDDEIAQLGKVIVRQAETAHAPSPEQLHTSFPKLSLMADSDDPEIATENDISMPRLPWLVVTAPDQRVFLPKERTPAGLFSMLDSVTTARAAALTTPYLGKWIEVSEPVVDVDFRDDHFVVLAAADNQLGRFVWMHFKVDGDDLEAVHAGDHIKVIGRIEELRFSTLRMYECELVRGP